MASRPITCVALTTLTGFLLVLCLGRFGALCVQAPMCSGLVGRSCKAVLTVAHVHTAHCTLHSANYTTASYMLGSSWTVG